jgi:DNA-binding MarR family transcriptional regulator
VRREPAETDGRGFEAVLTPEGLELRRAAQVTHHRGIRERFLEPLDRAQLEALGEAWKTLLPG